MEQQINISQNNNQEILINSNEPQLISLTNNEVQDILINQNENQNLNVTQPDNQLILIDGGGNIIGITDVLVNGVTVVSGNIAYITVPTKTSELQNNSGFITSETDPTVPSYIKQISLSDINSWNNKQNALVSGSTIKTINNESILGSGNLNITGTQYTAGSGIDITNDIISNEITSYNDLTDLPSIPTKTSDLINDSDFVTEDELSEVAFTGSYGSLSDTPIIPDATSQLTNDSDFINSTDLNTALASKQDTLVSGTNIKTINNTSLLGSGNITISGGTPTDVQINGTSITSNGIANIITEGVYNSSTNKIATKNDIPTATSQLINTGSDGTHPYIPTLDSSLKALGVSSGRLFWEYGSSLTDTTLANYSDLSSKQDTLVSGTNIKTINNNSILGNGNINVAVPNINNNFSTEQTINGNLNTYNMYCRTIEIGGPTQPPYIDFHFNNDFVSDYTSRIIETQAGKLNIDANLTIKNKEVLTPTVLYENTTGSNTSVTLSDSASNYNYMEIYFRSNDSINYKGSQKINNPNNATTCLSFNILIVGVMYYKTCIASISGNSITLSRQVEYYFTNNNAPSISETNNIYITKVVGY